MWYDYVGKVVLLCNKENKERLAKQIEEIKQWVMDEEGYDVLIRDDWDGLPIVIKWDDDQNPIVPREVSPPYEETPTETLAAEGVLLTDLTEDLWFFGYDCKEITDKVWEQIGQNVYVSLNGFLARHKMTQAIGSADEKEKEGELMERFVKQYVVPFNNAMADLKDVEKWNTPNIQSYYKREYTKLLLIAYDLMMDLMAAKENLELDLKMIAKASN